MEVTFSVLIRNFFTYMLLLVLIYLMLPHFVFRIIILLIFLVNFVSLIFFAIKIFRSLLTKKNRILYMIISSFTCSFICCSLWLYSFLLFLSPLPTAICIFVFSLLTLRVCYISTRQLASSKHLLVTAKSIIRHLLWIVCAESIVAFVTAFFVSDVQPNGLFICLNIASFLGFAFMLYTLVDVIMNWIIIPKRSNLNTECTQGDDSATH